MHLQVLVTALIPASELHPADRQVAGVYRVVLDDKVPADGRYHAAMDGFHYSVAIKVLDDFEFEVQTEQGQPVERAGDYENGDLLDFVHEVLHIKGAAARDDTNTIEA